MLAAIVLQGKTEEQAANRNSEVTERAHFDWLGLVLATASFTALVYGFTQAGTDGWNAPAVTGGVLTGESCSSLLSWSNYGSQIR